MCHWLRYAEAPSDMAIDDEARRQRIAIALAKLPDSVRVPPATTAQLSRFEQQFGTIPAEFKWFLSTCGGGVVGPESLDGIDELPESHQKYRKEFGPNGWSMQNVFIIGWDGAGNPIAIDKTTGRVLVEDHNFGGIHEVGTSLYDFLEKQIVA